MAKPNPFAGKKAPPFGKGGGGKAPPFGKKAPPMRSAGPDPDAAEDAQGFRRGGKVKRK